MGNYSSREFVATSGVSQGSNLGPFLFVLFINDICERISSKLLSFADIKFYQEIVLVPDRLKLQESLEETLF